MSDSIYSDVRDFIQGKLDAGLILRVDWVTAEIIADRDEPECADADFYLICARNHVADIVKRCIGKYSPKPSTDEQLKLPGFEHMQKAYQVDRQGIRLLVPTDALTDAELLLRADEYDAMAAGCVGHALEIREFVERRQLQAESA